MYIVPRAGLSMLELPKRRLIARSWIGGEVNTHRVTVGGWDRWMKRSRGRSPTEIRFGWTPDRSDSCKFMGRRVAAYARPQETWNATRGDNRRRKGGNSTGKMDSMKKKRWREMKKARKKKCLEKGTSMIKIVLMRAMYHGRMKVRGRRRERVGPVISILNAIPRIPRG